LARKTTANALRRMLATSGRTDPVLMHVEAGWDLADRHIIEAKLRLMDRISQWAGEEEARKEQQDADYEYRKDSVSAV
jgi:hypothetical protein